MKNEPAILFKESAASEAFVEAEADFAASTISCSGMGDQPQMTSAISLDYLTPSTQLPLPTTTSTLLLSSANIICE